MVFSSLSKPCFDTKEGTMFLTMAIRMAQQLPLPRSTAICLTVDDEMLSRLWFYLAELDCESSFVQRLPFEIARPWAVRSVARPASFLFGGEFPRLKESDRAECADLVPVSLNVFHLHLELNELGAQVAQVVRDNGSKDNDSQTVHEALDAKLCGWFAKLPRELQSIAESYSNDVSTLEYPGRYVEGKSNAPHWICATMLMRFAYARLTLRANRIACFLGRLVQGNESILYDTSDIDADLNAALECCGLVAGVLE
eukprot:jgi/Hompol1/1604/HPOL_005668-RA